MTLPAVVLRNCRHHGLFYGEQVSVFRRFFFLKIPKLRNEFDFGVKTFGFRKVGAFDFHKLLVLRVNLAVLAEHVVKRLQLYERALVQVNLIVAKRGRIKVVAVDFF